MKSQNIKLQSFIGKGTRLDILKKLPKFLVKVHEQPIIWYIMKTL